MKSIVLLRDILVRTAAVLASRWRYGVVSAVFASTMVCCLTATADVRTIRFASSVSATNVASSRSVDRCGIRPQDEIIVVNVRRVGYSLNVDRLADQVVVKVYQAADDGGRGQWQAADLSAVQGADPSVATLIFVHGNRMTPYDARHEGLAVYRRMVRESTSDAPIRFVVYSWPSAAAGGLLRDIRVKAARTGPAGYQLAWLVDQLPAEAPVSLVGFSFGARIVTGSLHALGGGSLCGSTLDQRQHPDRAPVKVVLLAAALHAHWLAPGQYHGEAMTQVDELMLVNNRQDRAMKYYHWVTRHGRPRGLGLCGPTNLDEEGSAKTTMRDVGRHVGSKHDLFRYLAAPGVRSELWESVAGER